MPHSLKHIKDQYLQGEQKPQIERREHDGLDYFKKQHPLAHMQTFSTTMKTLIVGGRGGRGGRKNRKTHCCLRKYFLLQKIEVWKQQKQSNSETKYSHKDAWPIFRNIPEMKKLFPLYVWGRPQVALEEHSLHVTVAKLCSRWLIVPLIWWERGETTSEREHPLEARCFYAPQSTTCAKWVMGLSLSSAQH